MSKTVNSKRNLRIVLANHRSLLSAALKSLLQSIPGFKVVGEIALESRSSNNNGLQEADLLLVYLSMASYQEVDQAERLLGKRPSLPSLVLTINTSKEYILQMLQAGVIGVLCQRSTFPELELSVRAVARREFYLTKALPQDVLDACQDYLKHPQAQINALTARQKTILKLIAEGANTKDIAHRLKLSSKTVEFHRARLMERLAIHDVAGLVRYAIRAGLIQV